MQGATFERRIQRALERRIRPRIHSGRRACTVASFTPVAPVDSAEALSAAYVPIVPGTAWGAPWSTTWFRISADVPREWHGRRLETLVDLGFTGASPGFQAEALAYDESGALIKGVFPHNSWLPVEAIGASWTCFVEAVAMPTIAIWPPTAHLGDPATYGSSPLYMLGAVELALVDEDALALAMDVEVLYGVMAELDDADPRRGEILSALSRSVDVLDREETLASARAELAPALAAPARRLAPRVSAIGHAHIDSAWLWPARETRRKCVRTFVSVCALADDYPELVFACPQAQQWAWIKASHPDLFARMKALVARGQIVPVGGMWIEPDTNLTGGESLVRQLVLGKEFFGRELGVETTEVWLPDCFGYSAALPQLIRLSGSTRFVTQKLSWNDTNRFPLHTFWWEGIDGSVVFSHMPPVDTYNAQLTPAELAFTVRHVGDQPPPPVSLVPFGYGDGGGGPTREMLERARRLSDLDGAPQVTVESPTAFFDRAELEWSDAPVWTGELYLERHRGTYTNQARLKRGNRRCEHLAREAELWAAHATLVTGEEYQHEELEQIWQQLLFNQFHDVLPGSSIAMVNDEAVASYASLAERLEGIIERATAALAGEGERELTFNAAPHDRAGIPSLGAAPARPTVGSVRLETGLVNVLDNGLLRVSVDASGRIASLYDAVAGRELVPPGQHAGALQLHPDHPNDYDGWDIDLFYRDNVYNLVVPTRIAPADSEPGEAALEVEHVVGSTRITQTFRLAVGERALVIDTEVEWQEAHSLLKLAFPLDVHADSTAAEIQFGHVRRPLNTNTSWDQARFEFVAHRFLHVGEPDYGVAIVNDGSYGHDAVSQPLAAGGRGVTARLSLVRGATFPDPRADAGLHRFRCAVVAGASLADAVREGYRLNLPLRTIRGARGLEPLITLDSSSVVVETVKLAQDRSGDLIVRCYESLGVRASTSLRFAVPAEEVIVTDLLERPLGTPLRLSGGAVELELRPFQILTLRVMTGNRGT